MERNGILEVPAEIALENIIIDAYDFPSQIITINIVHHYTMFGLFGGNVSLRYRTMLKTINIEEKL